MLEIIVLIAVLLLDQISKAICANWLTTLPEYTYVLIPDVFNLSYVENRGAAFGMLQNARVFFLIMTAIVSLFIIFYLIREHKKLHFLIRFSLSLILAGALGNFIDRLILGYVRDMFSAVIINFAVFNVADSAITVGTVLLFMDLMFFKGRYLLDSPKQESNEAKRQGDDADIPEKRD